VGQGGPQTYRILKLVSALGLDSVLTEGSISEIIMSIMNIMRSVNTALTGAY
jgi:hypothetical protein